ncbi:excinuclease ABC subunit A [Candidatus Woesebacteria bacterium RIFCSPHIGHO2_01_FULL_44_10]|uniref:UvrABC system protein A n=1 Tax=Candidatus Woesebacteria bacterium RIFCSPLOWO2_01_FULL_44_14 TaxID=1802525 RepID=A0A1F8BXF0_9BACT|nr:MAG: excinuclease ABC subunit A [Candidatus Woesebacteria bacterium RIFCSPHIGHO2_01_FULL_44_10]OGM55802.1 MAG: excinuclease ABC subunit A [Candidatus Woesebacteria bacterium RIFCSPHIGHO2_12_FULL_44_11]OGM68736.1 MAG: excinuclease ABC subunit A [Candidatus Woesebacteria bacterium RIFCSPLOWO2_01_FULL_44_14]
MQETIKIRGAREHNLKNIDLEFPKNKLVVFTGVSGSGKSSLAFDTIYAEGQRRYVESLSSYARQFLGVMAKPDVDLIEGLSPAISIDQKTTSANPRSTVGTITEVYDYLRLLFARIGHPHCPICGREIANQSLDQIVGGVIDFIKNSAKDKKLVKLLFFSPLVEGRKGEYSGLLENLRAKGYKRVRIDNVMHKLDEEIILIKTNKHTIEVEVDRISVSSLDNLSGRITQSVEEALKLSEGLVIMSEVKDIGFGIPEIPKSFTDHLFSERFACPVDNIQIAEIEPRTFSFNSPHGACPSCTGIGRILKVDPERIFAQELSITEGGILPYANAFDQNTWFSRIIARFAWENDINIKTPIKNLTAQQKKMLLWGNGRSRFEGIANQIERRHRTTQSDYARAAYEKFMREVICEACEGRRLKKEALAITIEGMSISQITDLSIKDAQEWVESLPDGPVARLIVKEIVTRLNFLISVGLDYLTLGRAAGTLAGGEAQRIRLASQIGTGLTGVLYVLDEPTIGLHPRDNARLIATLKNLRDLGNTVIVVEHDAEMMNSSDYLVDFGPGAGKQGGAIIASGSSEQVAKNSNSITGQYLSGKRKISITGITSSKSSKSLRLLGAAQYNLKNIDLEIPLGKFVAVTGVSGSGKSTLIVETLYHGLNHEMNPAYRSQPGEYKKIEGQQNVNKVSLIDQSPIGRTPRSNPATYTKTFDLIRQAFASTRDARAAGYKPGRFSFNVKGGRCEACEGQGQVKIEMQFMADIWVVCEVCKGTRYNKQTLEVEYKGKNISDVLSLTVAEAEEFFHAHPAIVRKLETLQAVGLDYMELGQSAPTLSGGEAQRVKLAAELGKKHSGHVMYILDEPTTGLHFADLEKLLRVLKLLVSKGNTVIVIEHNLDIIKNADWIIDLGPEGGEKGGEVIAQGTPDHVRKQKNSYTGQFLSK